MNMKKLKAIIATSLTLLAASCGMAPEPVYAEARHYDQAHVIRVIDGDTADLTVDLGFGIQLQDTFRFYGIDTPEKNQPGNKEATAKLKELILDKDVAIDYYSKDKYGRRLAIVYVTKDGQRLNVNDFMVQNGFAKSYFGGKKD